MAAHSRPFKTTCDQIGCDKRATEQVFNTYNAPQGVYCARHAKERVKELQSAERIWEPRP